MKKILLWIVEEPAVPQRVRAARAVVEVARVRAVELVEAVQRVLGGVRVHHVEQDVQPQLVRAVDQLLQLARGAVTTGINRFKLSCSAM